MGVNVYLRFNPTLVRLRRAPGPSRGWPPPRFNPTLVRLRPRTPQRWRRCNSRFQSHAGSIEAGGAAERPAALLPFQSHAGSIEADAHLTEYYFDVSVSIPRWFD